ncbi:MAG: adenylate/guanylate cyclase domain-containing protein [Termitinemataceae bacterium]|nr:MAG: adenylate/guanylate cyclase domain-containing protein [Termitinemataceae bacterium]
MADQMKVKFPIVLKMFLVITITLFISFGIIIMLSHYFIYTSVKNTHEMNNRALNDKARSFTESSFTAVYRDILYFMSKDKSYKIDWRVNKNIAAIYSQNKEYTGSTKFDNTVINNEFFIANNCSTTGLRDFFEFFDLFDLENNQQNEIYGDIDSSDNNIDLFDAREYFDNLPVLVMRIRSNNMIHFGFFIAEEVVSSFSTGANTSILLNNFAQPLILSNIDDYTNGSVYTAQRLFKTMKEHRIKTGDYKNGGKEGFYAIQNISIGKTNIFDFGDQTSGAIITFVDKDVVFESINNTTLRNIYLAFGVWFISIIIIWFFSLGISDPLLKLNSVSARIEDGEYEIKLKITSKDETGLLTETMNNLAVALGNFEKFTNRTIARLARKEILPLGGENKNATFFFSDIRSFTAISEHMTPAQVVNFLNDYMYRMVACVLITGGAIDKFIGDAVMAHWGAVESTGNAESDAVNAVTASLLMRASLASFNVGRGSFKKPIIKIGCGLNSGTVVAGLIGTDEKIEYTVIGDAVSFADRCETFNKAYGSEIVISEHTYNLIGDKFIVEEMKTVTENNMHVKTYAVINIKDPVLLDKVFQEYLFKIPKMNLIIAAKCIGPTGPQTLEDVRTLLNIESVDLSTVNVDEDEKKYSVAGK